VLVAITAPAVAVLASLSWLIVRFVSACRPLVSFI
jgi:hypothetical protein